MTELIEAKCSCCLATEQFNEEEEELYQVNGEYYTGCADHPGCIEVFGKLLVEQNMLCPTCNRELSTLMSNEKGETIGIPKITLFVLQLKEVFCSPLCYYNRKEK